MSTVVRRSLTISTIFILTASLPILLVALPIAGLVDLIRASNWAIARAIGFFAVYVLCEAAGITASFAVWLIYKLVPQVSHTDYLRLNFRLQCWWASTLLRGIELIFAIRTDVHGSECLHPGPILVYSRHASSGDTILPAVLISSRHDIVLRYVLKRELLWDPCLDIVGNRLQNHFVDRKPTASAREVEAVAQLAVGLGRNEGVLIYPEGTRFSESKRERAIERLTRDGNDELVQLAQSMHNVLPPKLGGPVALLQQNPNLDLILLAHTGFEDVESLATLFNGSLIGRTIRIRLWRVSRKDIPQEADAIARWLFETWGDLDRWIEENRDHPAHQNTQHSLKTLTETN